MFRLVNHGERAALLADGLRYDLAKLSGNRCLPIRWKRCRVSARARAAAIRDAGRTGSSRGTARAGPDAEQGVPRSGSTTGRTPPTTMNLPPAPLTFTKFPSCLCGPTADIALSCDRRRLGSGTRRRRRRSLHDAADDEAWDHVAGLTLGQDISDRTLQFSGDRPQFSRKSFDTYGPLGPAVVSIDTLADHDDIAAVV